MIDQMPDQMLDQMLGHYRIVSKIGQGGMGVVYRARDEILHRDVALKIISAGAGLPLSSREFLLHEARASSALGHPNICMIHQIGEFNGEPYIVMELVEGRSLSSLIPSGGMAVESVMRYGVQIAAALAHSHSRSIVHRDLKSGNVVVTGEGLVKVLDFGLARRLPGKASEDEATRIMDPLESGGGVVGTLSYMPPELLRGLEADARSDLWALGVVLFETAAGQLPFRGNTRFEISSAILNEITPPLPSRVPPGLAAIIQRCLAKEPSQRYQQASEVQAAIEAIQSAAIVPREFPTDQRGPQISVHRGIPNVNVRSGDTLLLVGTTKGAFILRSTIERRRWEVGGPYFHGHIVNALAYDGRAGRHRLWASTHSVLWGTFLRSSDDFGKTWTNPQEAQIKFPAESGASLKNVWQISLGHPDEPDALYCGVEPAALFKSEDAGETWSLCRSLYDHPHRPRWMPGNGGLSLHTILPDPISKERMYVAISSGGVYRTDDGGASWRAFNRGIRAIFMPEKFPEFGQCVHKIVMHPSKPERLFLQNHWGLYRSDDAGDSWQDIANGVPSDFGFAMVMHPNNPDCIYIVPVESDEFRCTPGGRLRVYRTRNGGGSWEPLMRGLPQKGAYETILRDAMTADSLQPTGIFFGTRNGNLYGSTDDGRNWTKILEGLPAVVCVRAAIYGEPRVERKPAASPKPDTRRKPRAVIKPKAPAKANADRKTKVGAKAKTARTPSSAPSRAKRTARKAGNRGGKHK